MKQLKSFLFTTLLGGLTVLLPLAIVVFIFNWLFETTTEFLQPLVQFMAIKVHLSQTLAKFLSLALILATCFLFGLLEKTKLGSFFFSLIETHIFNRIPGHRIIKETIGHFIGTKSPPFSSVALARIFNNDTLVTAFITQEHPDGLVTIFVPTGPNPTSGNIFHLKEEYIIRVNAPIDDTMKSIISCGAGSNKILEKWKLDKKD